MKYIRNMIKDNKGATAIEYGLIAALIAVAAIVAMQFVGREVTETFDKVGKTLETANSNTSSTSSGE